MKTKLILLSLLASGSVFAQVLPVLPVFPGQALSPGALPVFSAPSYAAPSYTPPSYATPAFQRPVPLSVPAPTYDRSMPPTGPVLNPPFLGQPYRTPVLPRQTKPVYGLRY